MAPTDEPIREAVKTVILQFGGDVTDTAEAAGPKVVLVSGTTLNATETRALEDHGITVVDSSDSEYVRELTGCRYPADFTERLDRISAAFAKIEPEEPPKPQEHRPFQEFQRGGKKGRKRKFQRRHR